MYSKERLIKNIEGEKKEQVYGRIISLLGSSGVSYEEYFHKPLFTMGETEEVYGGIPEQQVKVIFAREYQTKSVYSYCLLVWTGNKKIEFQKVAEKLKAKKISMASSEEVFEQLEIKIGALSPFGYSKKYRTIIDGDLFDQQDLYINPGVHDKTIKLSSVDMFRLIGETAEETIVF